MKEGIALQRIDRIAETLEKLVHIPSPSGYTEQAIDFCRSFADSLGLSSKVTNKGGLLITVPGKDTANHRLLTAHVDTLGAMVKEIKADGTLSLAMVGGFRWNSVEGEYCTIHSKDKAYSGTILMHQTSVHVYRDAGEAKRNEKNIEVRIDEQTVSREETEALGIRVGDFISFDPRFERTDSGFIKSRHLDDKASVAILLELLRELKEDNWMLPYTTHVFISNNEEIGYGGNSSIPPEVVEYIAVDMGAIGDGQATTEYDVSICVKDSSGPYHYALREQLAELAQSNDLQYKLDIYPYYSSDASAAIRAGYDIRHGLIGPGIAASHAFERTHEKALAATYALLEAYFQSKML
ncbi:Putative aminopeptidase FrvX [Terribacillus halophilus]|uniref:Putative aminopeptidase FrvX n=1 Tax=Terribacillus halophilus TaxID=361279 RepID=A0A1G6VKS7_9BACI|nr:M42 family metallopeptidase [Terribacillus halophilus]SDD53505.1 Putative aminopeptidase FrvX [Terribacillus halophilus]